MTRYLEEHPQVFMAQRKDLHFFGTDLQFQHRTRTSEAAYLAHFTAAATHQIMAESSVWYLYSQAAAEEIYARNPHAKILVMLRHPVEMMHALWGQLRLNGLGDENIPDFAEALAAEPDRSKGRRLPPNTPLPEALLYRRTARFSEQIQRYQSIFPPEQIHIVIQEEMKADTLTIWTDVCHWLGLDPSHRPELTTVNRSKTVRSEGLRALIGATPSSIKSLIPDSARKQMSRWLRRINSTHAQRTPIPRELYTELCSEFATEIQTIEQHLGRQIVHWK